MHPNAIPSPSLHVFSDPASQTVPQDQAALTIQISEARTQLHSLISQGQTQEVLEFFDKPLPEGVLKGLSQGATPFHVAAAFNRSQIIGILHSHLPDGIDARNGNGHTPLMSASKKGNVEALEALLAAGADVGMQDGQGWTAFFWATFMGMVDALKALLGYEVAARVDPVALKINLEAKDNEGNTPLAIAIQHKQYEAAAFLLKSGADVNAKNKAGVTPTMLAAAAWDVPMLTLLKESGANLNDTDNADRPALLHAACQHKAEFDAEALRNIIWQLRQLGADLEWRTREKQTPLMLLLGLGRCPPASPAARPLQAAKLFIAAGADVNARDNAGETILVQAGTAKKRDATELLIDHGADVNAKDNRGRVPLTYACKRNDLVFAQQLLKAGASMDVKDDEQVSPLTYTPDGDDSMRELFANYRKQK